MLAIKLRRRVRVIRGFTSSILNSGYDGYRFSRWPAMLRVHSYAVTGTFRHAGEKFADAGKKGVSSMRAHKFAPGA
jgi:hypothetical protein